MNRISSFLSCAAVTVLLATGCQSKGGPLKVGEVEPNQGINAGGDQVTINGSGFVPGKTQVEVRFGRARAEQVSIASATEINVVTPPGDKGPVDITLMFDSGEQFKIQQGFRYVDSGRQRRRPQRLLQRQARRRQGHRRHRPHQHHPAAAEVAPTR